MIRRNPTQLLATLKHSHRHHSLKTWLGQACPWSHLSHLTKALAMVTALIHPGEVNIPGWIPYIPCRGLFAQSKQRRVSRWLHNARIQVDLAIRS